MSDVAKIFAAEDWKKIYQAMSQVDLSSYDFDNLRRVLLDYVKNNFPEDFNDFIESSEFIALIDMMAYLGQSLAFRVDLNSRENFIDTATRRDSVIRLARLVGYTPKRNIAASGMLKLNSLSTSQDLVDSNGNTLRNVTVTWNDPTNPNFQEQFNIILNQAMGTNQRVGRPARRAIIDGIVTEVYEINSLNINPTLPFTQAVGGTSMDFELVGAFITKDGALTERVPVTSSGFSLLYRNDGKGNGSPESGWFAMFKQGTLNSVDFGVTDALPNQVISINSTGINNEDTWLFELTQDGNISALWENVPEVSGNNVIYNSLSRNVRKVYSTVAREGDRVDLAFADGVFGDIPNGDFRYYFRNSNGLSYQIKPIDMTQVQAELNVRTKRGELSSLNLNFGLKTTVSNSAPAESFLDVKVRAPQNYYTQNRMITAEDYNIYPVITNQNVLKAKAVNRTSSGTNRYLDIVDPTGKYSALKIFADDGMIYRKDFNETFSFVWSVNASDIVRVIQDRIRPYLVNEELNNFYYVNFDRVNYRNVGLIWTALHNDVNSYDGYFADEDGEVQIFGPAAGSYPFNAAAKGTLVKFEAPLGKYFDQNLDLQSGVPGLGHSIYIWTKILTIVGDARGDNGTGVLADGGGTVIFSDKVPSGAKLAEAMPALSRDFGQLEVDIFNSIQNKQDFGLGYDAQFSAWYYIDNRDLSANQDFSLTYSKDTSKNNLDSSWLMKFQYRNEQYKATVRLLQTIFRSTSQNKFYFDSRQLIKDPLTGKTVVDQVFVLKTNTDWSNDNKIYSKDIPFHIIGNVQDVDGYIDPSEIRLSFADQDNDQVPDDPDSFDRLVNPNSITANKAFDFAANEFVMIFERYTDSSGLYRWRPRRSDDVVVVDTLVNIGTTGPNLLPYVDGQLIYCRQDKKMYVWDVNNGEYNPTSVYRAYPGRQGLQFKYEHNAADTRRIDPALSNLIDVYVMTKSYNSNLRNWLKFDRNELTKPQASSSQELRGLLSSIERVKGMSDDIIYHPVKFKLIFGSKAEPGLRAKFKVRKNSNSLVSDNEVRSRVVSAIDLFFANANYDFGDTFYFTELAAFVHMQLSGLISSIVIVPESDSGEFGDLFQITSMPDEILLHDVTVDDVVMVSTVTPASISN